MPGEHWQVSLYENVSEWIAGLRESGLPANTGLVASLRYTGFKMSMLVMEEEAATLGGEGNLTDAAPVAENEQQDRMDEGPTDARPTSSSVPNEAPVAVDGSGKDKTDEPAKADDEVLNEPPVSFLTTSFTSPFLTVLYPSATDVLQENASVSGNRALHTVLAACLASGKK